MSNGADSLTRQHGVDEHIEHFRKTLGPFAAAAERTHMPMIFADAQVQQHPVVFANESFLAFTGFSRDEIIGMPLSFLFKELSAERTFTAIATAIVEGIEGTWETYLSRRIGEGYLASIFLSPVIDEQGTVVYYFFSFVDVGGRIERQLNLPTQFRELYANMPDFVAITEGKEHRYIYANASYERLLGRKNLVGQKVDDVLGMREQGAIALLDHVFATGKPFLGKGVPVYFSDEPGGASALHHLNFVYQPVRDRGGDITGVFTEGHDVTAERFAIDQLAYLQGEMAHASRVNAMGMMAATLAHELNQPLLSISNYAGAAIRLVNAGSLHSDAAAEAFRGIEEAAERMGAIIRNVRGLTKRGESPRAEFNVRQAIRECAQLVSAGGGCQAASIDIHVPEDLTMVGDRIQFQQVVINLLRNACDAMDPTLNGHITVDAGLQAGDVVVRVTDMGHGLSSEAAENIFNWTDSSKEGGTGLGLAISRTIVEGHNGRIWLERSDASGSQFCFSIPPPSAAAGRDDAG